jgi:hypothetical protein
MVTALALTSTTPRLTRKCSLHVYISASIEALLWLYSLSGALTSTTLRLTRKCSLYVPLTSTTVFPIYREHCPICATNVNDSVPVHIGNTVETLTSTTVFPYISGTLSRHWRQRQCSLYVPLTSTALTSTTPRLTRKFSLYVYISASIEALLRLY